MPARSVKTVQFLLWTTRPILAKNTGIQDKDTLAKISLRLLSKICPITRSSERNRLKKDSFLVFLLSLLSLTTLDAFSATLPPGFSEEAVGGSWNYATGLTFAKDGRMFVWEKAGRVWLVENGVRLAQPLIDIHEEVGDWVDHGLLGFALDPSFLSNGRVYLFYVVDHHHLVNYGTPNYNPSANEYHSATIGRITRYTAKATDGFRSVDPASRKILVGETINNGIPLLYTSHGVGSLVFGTDGTLLASCGEGASYISKDMGSASETWYLQALSEGIIQAKENVGAFRSQLVDSLSGKILRINPATGDGVPSNPFYDPANPRSARSRVWVLGLRNPYRMTLRPGTGSSNPADGNPGVFYLGDVGWGNWEDMNVVTGPGRNFGWPIFEGSRVHSDYYDSLAENRDAPNPLFGVNGCTQRYFYFRDLVVQDTLNPPSWPNPCNAAEQIPSTLPRFMHTRPALEWKHYTTRTETGIYSGANAATIRIGEPGSPVSGQQFPGTCSIGGTWYSGTDFPQSYSNTYFHADFTGRWIKNFTFDQNDRPISVRNFLDGGYIVCVATDPTRSGLYYISYYEGVRKISFAVNAPPVAVATANKTFGPGPLSVQFVGSNSTDPEGFPLSFQWSFGDGTTSSAGDPTHVFTAPSGVSTRYDVVLTVTDNQGATSTATLLISVNNTPPSVSITSPLDDWLYPVTGETTIDLTADISDAEQGPGLLTYAWQTFLRHDTHEHLEATDHNRSATTIIHPIGCAEVNVVYYYRIVLTVTDSAGLSTTAEANLYPDCPEVVDTDGDGISDEWELAYGLNPNLASDASLDLDGDGFTNLKEFLAGTDPQNPASVLGILKTELLGDNICIYINSISGKQYLVERSLAYPADQWEIVQEHVPGTGGIVQVLDAIGSSFPKCFYRVSLSH
jgi:glucose/arabinose dehydrogenase